jgi:hypothetical protein
MSPKNQSFKFKDLLRVLRVNLKVVIAVSLFLVVFFALFFGYYSLILIAFTILFLVYSLIDTLHQKTDKNQEETDGK